MPQYEATQFQPPAPTAYVSLRNPSSGVVLPNIMMLLDTGSDVTLVPTDIARQLQVNISEDNQFKIAGYDGSIGVAPVVQLELVFCRRIFRGQFLLIDQQYGILGRNVLNAVPLVFDGPKLAWDERKPT